MGMTKLEAINRLIDFSVDTLQLNVSLSQVEQLLDYLTSEDGVNGLGCYPPLTKKGKYEWESEQE